MGPLETHTKRTLRSICRGVKIFPQGRARPFTFSASPSPDVRGITVSNEIHLGAFVAISIPVDDMR